MQQYAVRHWPMSDDVTDVLPLLLPSGVTRLLFQRGLKLTVLV